MSTLDAPLDGATVVVCCGSGGVGKTTTAAVIGIELARRDQRVVVVTIDPARRLADALGLPDGLGAEPQRIDLDAARRAVGDDARHRGDVRPGRARQRGRRRAGRPHRAEPLLPQHGGRPERHAGVHGVGGAAPAPRRRAVRRRRRRHAAEPPRPRLPRGAGRARPVPRPQGVQAVDAADARRPAGVEHRRPADPARDRAGRRFRRARRRRRLLPGLRRDGGRVSRAGGVGDGPPDLAADALRPGGRAAARHRRRGRVVRRPAPRARHRCGGGGREPGSSAVRVGDRGRGRRAGGGRGRSGRSPPCGRTSPSCARSPNASATRSRRSTTASAGAPTGRGAAAGRRRARPRRPGRDRHPPVRSA